LYYTCRFVLATGLTCRLWIFAVEAWKWERCSICIDHGATPPPKISAGHSPGRSEGECSPGVGGGSPVLWCRSCYLQLVDLSDLIDFKRK